MRRQRSLRFRERVRLFQVRRLLLHWRSCRRAQSDENTTKMLTPSWLAPTAKMRDKRKAERKPITRRIHAANSKRQWHTGQSRSNDHRTGIRSHVASLYNSLHSGQQSHFRKPLTGLVRKRGRSSDTMPSFDPSVFGDSYGLGSISHLLCGLSAPRRAA